MQSIILLSLVGWSLINPTANLTLVIGIGLIIAIASATQDITVDALESNKLVNMKVSQCKLVLQWQLLVGGLAIN